MKTNKWFIKYKLYKNTYSYPFSNKPTKVKSVFTTLFLYLEIVGKPSRELCLEIYNRLLITPELLKNTDNIELVITDITKTKASEFIIYSEDSARKTLHRGVLSFDYESYIKNVKEASGQDHFNLDFKSPSMNFGVAILDAPRIYFSILRKVRYPFDLI